MKTCKTVTFKTPSGLVITGENTISDDLVKYYKYSPEIANRLVEDIVNTNSEGVYSFGSWLYSHNTEELGTNHYTDEFNIPTATAVVSYIKYLKNTLSGLDNQIVFPDVKIDKILSLEVFQSFATTYFGELQSQGITFNHFLSGEKIPSSIFSNTLSDLVADLKVYQEFAEYYEETAKVKELGVLIDNIRANPYYFLIGFNRFLETFDVQAQDLRYSVNNELDDTSVEVTQEEEDNLVSNEENADADDIIISKDSAFYDSKLKVDFKTTAPKSIKLLFNTLIDVEAELKESSKGKKTYTREDFNIYAIQDSKSGLTKVAEGNKLLSLVHSILVDVEPNIDSHIAALQHQADIFYMSEQTAHQGARLDYIIKRINTYTKGSEILTEVEKLLVNPPKSLIEIKDLHYREQLRTQWVQQFTKTNNRYYSNIIENYGMFIRENHNNRASINRVINTWQANLNTLISNSGGPKQHLAKLNAIRAKMLGAKVTDIYKEFFTLVGINIPNIEFYSTITLDGMPATNNNSAVQEFGKALLEQSAFNAVELQNLFNFKRDNPIRTKARKFALLVAKYTTKDIDLATYNLDNEQVHSLGLHNSMTLTSLKVNTYLSNLKNLSLSTQEELIKTYESELNTDYSLQKNAPSFFIDLVQSGEFSLNVNIENGLESKPSGRKNSTRKLDLVDRFISDLKTVGENAAPLLQAGDRPVYMSLNITNKGGIEIPLMVNNKTIQLSRLKNHIRYELLQSKKYYEDGVGKDIKNVSHDAFRMFQGLEKSLGKSMQDLTKETLSAPIQSYQEVATVFQDKDLEAIVDNYLNDLITNNGNNLFQLYQSIGVNILQDIEFAFIENLYQTSRKEAFENFIATQLANYGDQVRLFTGDASIFKDASDFAKRYMTLNSSKKIQRVDASINTVINLTQLMPSFELQDVGNNPSWRNYATSLINNGISPTVTLQEPVTRMANEEYNKFKAYVNQFLSPENQERDLLQDYENDIEYADGIGYITFDAYRRLQIRSGNWFIPHENIYQAVLNNRPISYVELQQARMTPLKLQYSGPYMTIGHKGAGLTAIRKYAVMPLIPGIVKEGTMLDNLMKAMQRNKIEQAVVESGAKITHGKTYTLENFESEFNQAIDEDMFTATDDLNVEYLGIQTDINEHPKGIVTQSKQMRKHTLLDITDNDESLISEELQKSYDEYDQLHSTIVQNKVNTFFDELGIRDVNFQNWNQKDLSSFVGYIQSAAKKRNMPLSMIQNIGRLNDLDFSTNEREIVFIDELPIVKDIEFLVTKLYKSNVISLKRTGEAYMQVPDLGGTITGDKTLEFYRIADNNTILPMQVKETLPNELFDYVANVYGGGKFTFEALDKFNEDLKKDEEAFIKSKGKKVTTLTKMRRRVAFRIPHQSKSFTDIAHVVEFTHPLLSNITVVPRELVIKNNSDFDSDKFNAYQPDMLVKDNKISLLENSDMNKLLDLEYTIGLSYETFYQNIIPANDKILSSFAEEIAQLKGINLSRAPMSDLLNVAAQYRAFVRYKEGKGNVGINVNNISALPLIQKAMPNANNSDMFLNFLFDEMVTAESKRLFSYRSNQLDLGLLKSQMLDQFTTGSLDAANTTGYPFEINLYGDGLKAILAGIHLGNYQRTLLFMNQPIVSNYINAINKNRKGVALVNRENKTVTLTKTLLPYGITVEKFEDLAAPLNYSITNQDLKDAIKNPNTEKGKAIQITALKLYTILSSENSKLLEFIISQSADNSNFKTFADLSNMIEKINPNNLALGFLNTLRDGLFELNNFTATSKFSTEFGELINNTVSSMVSTSYNLKFNPSAQQQIRNAMHSEVMAFMISDSILGENGFSYSKEVERLTEGENTVAKQVHNIINDPNNPYRTHPFFTQFTPLLDYQGSGHDVMIGNQISSNTIDKNIIDIKAEQLLRSPYKDLVKDIVKLSLVQSGFLSTKFNLLPFINSNISFLVLNPYLSTARDMILAGDTSFLENAKYKFVKTFLLSYMHHLPIDQNAVADLLPDVKSLMYLKSEGKKVLLPKKINTFKGLPSSFEYITSKSSLFIKDMRTEGDLIQYNAKKGIKINLTQKAIQEAEELNKKCNS